MKKILLSLFGIIILGLINFSSADFVVEGILDDSHNSFSLSSTGVLLPVLFQTYSDACYLDVYDSDSNLVERLEVFSSGVFRIASSVDSSFVDLIYLSAGNYTYDFSQDYSSCDSFQIYVLTSSGGNSSSSGEECTQLKCENDYNLIPESSINSEYCEENFGLIDPENCPSSGGSGDVLWSSFFVNSHQVQGASNIYLWLPDFLNWDYTYIDSGSTLEINVENEGDQDYIQGIIDVNSYRPTNDEFVQSFVGGLTLLIPYIVVVLFVVAIWKLIKKIFSK